MSKYRPTIGLVPWRQIYFDSKPIVIPIIPKINKIVHESGGSLGGYHHIVKNHSSDDEWLSMFIGGDGWREKPWNEVLKERKKKEEIKPVVMSNKVTIYTDGSSRPKRKTLADDGHDHGGYGIYFQNGTVRLFSGGQYVNTTNSRMELMGVLEALKKCEIGDEVDLYCDNQYVVNAFKEKWVFKWEKNGWIDFSKKGGKRLNYDLLKQILIQYRRLNNKVTFHWVRGHNGCEENEICDILAKMGGANETIIIDNRP